MDAGTQVVEAAGCSNSPPITPYDAASNSTDRDDSLTPSSNNLTPPPSSKIEEYRQLFSLPCEETLIGDFNCAYQESILIQGHMYLFLHHICFYSNILGFETKKIILLSEITSIRKAKTAWIFPNAIELFSGDKKHIFASFLSRDEAFKLIDDGLSRVATLTVNGSVPEDACEIDKISTSDEPVSQISEELEVETVDCAWVPSQFQWVAEDMDAPNIPQHYIKVAESKFPLGVEEFFNLFFSDDAAEFVESYHRKCGDKDFCSSPWNSSEEFGYVREVSFKHPIKLSLISSFSGCKETQKFRVFRDNNLIVETCQHVSDAPYANHFCVEGLWNVEEDEEQCAKSCCLSVYINVFFCKKTLWKGRIEHAAADECRNTFGIWIDTAHELLKERRCLIQENDEGRLGDLSGNAELNPHKESNREEGLNGCGSLFSFVRGFIMSLSLKPEGPKQFWAMFFVFSLIIFLQLSIVVLLSRPHQVHVVSGGVVADGWLERYIGRISDEIAMMGARIERMQHDHLRLKEELEELQQMEKRMYKL